MGVTATKRCQIHATQPLSSGIGKLAERATERQRGCEKDRETVRESENKTETETETDLGNRKIRRETET